MQEQSYKYWAFISYSHRDQAWAEWLHKALETYRVPRRLVGRESSAGPVPRRLFPIFRDQEELPSSPNLSAAIDQALQQSRYLIVIASPYAAVSKWVDQEIARFRALGRSDRILCLIVDGEPHADLQPGRGLLECFPPCLRATEHIEPIAADVRPTKDSKLAAKLKLICGLLGVGLDELRRRERRRRVMRNAIWLLASLALITVVVGLWRVEQEEKRKALSRQALQTHIESVYEQGRQELLAHNQARAAVYLNEAYRLGVDTPALRFMLARAMRLVEAPILDFQTGSPVTLVGFSPDSRSLFTKSSDNVVRVWDTVTGRQKFGFEWPQHSSLAGPRFSRSNRYLYLYVVPDEAVTGYLKVWDAESGRVLGIFNNARSRAHTYNPFDSSGRRVVHLAPDQTVEIDDLESGSLIKRFPGVYSITGFSRDGRRLLIGREDGAVEIWDGSGLHKIRSLSGLHSPVASLDDTEDGSLVAAASRDGSIRSWQSSDGALRLLAGHPSVNPGLIFNIDGARLLTWAAEGARVWDTRSGALIYAMQFAGGRSNQFDISSDGRLLMTSSSSRLAVQDIQSGVELYTLDGHGGLPQARDISDDDRSIATGGPDGRVVLWRTPQVWNIEFDHPIDRLKWPKRWDPGVAAVYSHSGTLIATGGADGRLAVWSARSYSLIRNVVADPLSVNVVAFNAEDSRILSAGEVSGVKIWDVSSGRLLLALDCDGKEVLGAAFSNDGRYVVAATFGGATRIWDAQTGAVVASFAPDEGRSPRFSADGTRLALGGKEFVTLWDIKRGQMLWKRNLPADRQGPGSFVADVDFSADGRRLLVAKANQQAYVVDAAGGAVLDQVLEPAASEFRTARFDARGERAVMGDRNGLAVVWQPGDARTWILRGHAGEVRSADFSSDGAYILTSGVDGTAKLWDSGDGQLLDTIAEHSRPMPDVPFQASSFRPDGAAVLTGSTDGVIREWDLRRELRNPQQLDAILRCRVPWRLQGDALVTATPSDSACPP